MPSIRSILLFGLSTLSLCKANVKPEERNEISIDEVVRWLPEESVRAALRANLAPKYRDGVFEHGKKAIEAIQNADPQLAAKVVDAALQRELERPDLKKRQSNTTTTDTTTTDTKTTDTKTTSTTKTPVQSTPPDTSTSSPDTDTDTKTQTQTKTTETGVIVPVTITTTDDSGSTVTKKTSAFQTTAETSTVVDETTTNDSGQTITTQKTVPAVAVTTTNSAGKTITTASTLSTVHVVNGGHVVKSSGKYTTTDQFGNSIVLSGTSSGQKITTTDAAGKTVVMTYTPGGGAISELVEKTKTLPNGQQTVVTSFAVVGGPTQGAEQTGGQGPPGLQTNLASPTGRYIGEMAALFGGAIGVAAML